MDFRTLIRAAILLTILAGLVLPATAQNDKPSNRGFSSLVNIEAMLDNYIHFLSRKYDLTADQDAFTQELVRERVDSFLARYEGNLQDVVDQLFEVRTGGDMSPEELIEWGRQVRPIYEDAKLVIVEANSEWREILTEEQKLIHDEDLKLMHESFNTTENQLQRMLTGQMSVDEFRNPRKFKQSQRLAEQRRADARRAQLQEPVVPRVSSPTARSDTTHRPTPSPADNQSNARRPSERSPRKMSESTPKDRHSGSRPRDSRNPKSMAGTDFESRWEAYVREFIARYQLTPDQQERAQKILKSCQEQGCKYIRVRKAEIEKLEQQAAALKGSKDQVKTARLAELSDRRTKLLAPIEDIFDKQLKPRLEKIPTRAQREAAEKVPPKSKREETSGKPEPDEDGDG
ncbi:MAG: hypothetical protein ABIG44_08500 [Planctomycetota bacterium]